jgi:hypothetical protein
MQMKKKTGRAYRLMGNNKNPKPATQQEWPAGRADNLQLNPVGRRKSVQPAVEHFRGTIGDIFINVIKAVVLPGGQPTEPIWRLRSVKGDMYPFILDCDKVVK